MNDEILSIGEAARILGVSIQTLRRWDKSGKLNPIKIGGGHRRYKKSDLERLINNIAQIAWDWEIDTAVQELDTSLFCMDSPTFQTRLEHLRYDLSRSNEKNIVSIYPLIVAVTGVIGNNSFDHNLGNWPYTRGIFFGYDLQRKQIVIADRGIGILTSLKRVRPNIKDHAEALKVAFTERLSGRAPEARGNGLKLVRKVVYENPLILDFRTGNARLTLRQGQSELDIHTMDSLFHGCFASLTF